MDTTISPTGKICSRCNEHPIDGYRKKLCHLCRLKQRRHRSRSKYRERKNAGMCPNCGSAPPDDGYSKCSRCREYQDRWNATHYEALQDKARRMNEKYRNEAFQAYGSVCQCCGEDRVKFLSLDHINGDGQKHRARVGYGTAMYASLKCENWPEGLQVLCFNCHMAKDFRGSCPHTEPDPERIMPPVLELTG